MQGVVGQLKLGDHVASFYRTQEEQFAVAIPYIRIGLERHERCLYIADDNSARDVIAALDAAGVDTSDAIARGQLTVTTKHSTYLRSGAFDPNEMIRGLADEVRRSVQAGFTGFRATGEMTWALTLPYALGRLIEYESELDSNYPARFLGLCQYNERGFQPELISEILRTHPKVIARGRLFENPHYIRDHFGKLEAQPVPLPRVTVEDLVRVTA